MPSDELNLRTQVILIETETRGDELLAPHTVRALRAYADAVEARTKGNTSVDEMVVGKSTIRVIHGSDHTVNLSAIDLHFEEI